MTRPPTRRSVLLGGGAVLLSACTGGNGDGGRPPTPGPPTRPSPRPATPVPGLADGAFALGVASGDPLPDAVVLWTRIAPDPTSGGGAPAQGFAVQWEVAADERFARVMQRGEAAARPESAHSVHVDVKGLQPARDYFYRFRAGTQLSPVGRTRTAPAAGARTERVRLALASCQDYQNGFYTAHAGIAAEDLDAVLFVGDYIYEYDPRSRLPGRAHTAPQRPGLDQLRTLADYRNRHAQYKTDPDLQAAHAAHPWIVTWDDHEVENNHAGLVDEADDTGPKRQDRATFARQRAAAYQAYFEHLPIRPAQVPGSPDYLIYRRFGFGDLVSLSVLDTRQYRTDQPGPFPFDFGPAERGVANTAGTMTGGQQEAWLRAGLSSSRAQWNVVGQQTQLGQLRVPGGLTLLDQWDGYVPARTRLLSFLRDARIGNPVVLTGDIHSSWVHDLRVEFDRPETPVIGTEFVGPGISSGFFLGEVDKLIRDNNPHVRYFDRRPGYVRVEFTPARTRADYRYPATIDRRPAPTATGASFVVAAGRAGAERV
jgi:alkaline phosphatase D